MLLESLTAAESTGTLAQQSALDSHPAESLPDYVSRVIHDQVLQSLAVSSIQAELCRRLWERGRPEEAVAELAGIQTEIEAAADLLRGLLLELREVSPRSRSA